jgi:hypothetical protein
MLPQRSDIGGGTMKTAGFLLFVLVGACLLVCPAAAQPQSPNDDESLDLKRYGCEQHLDLVDLEDGRAEIVTVWAHGFYHGMRGTNESSDTGMWMSVEDFSEELLKTCKREPEKLFIAVVKEMASAKPPSRR